MAGVMSSTSRLPIGELHAVLDEIGGACQFLCKGPAFGCCVMPLARCSEVGVDAVGVDDGELGEGGFPAGDDLTLDEPAGGFAVVAG